MKIKLIKWNDDWRYSEIYELIYTQEQFDYIYKYLDFDKFNKNDNSIYFKNKKTEDWFYKKHIHHDWLEDIYDQSPEGYQYLKENWGNGFFKITVFYSDKQELKTIANKVINIELKKD